MLEPPRHLPAPVSGDELAPVPADPDAPTSLTATGTLRGLDGDEVALPVEAPLAGAMALAEPAALAAFFLGGMLFGTTVAAPALVLAGAVMILRRRLAAEVVLDFSRDQVLLRSAIGDRVREEPLATLEDVAAVALRPEPYRPRGTRRVSWRYRLVLLLRQGSVLAMGESTPAFESALRDAHALARRLRVRVIEPREGMQLQLRTLAGEPQGRLLPPPDPDQAGSGTPEERALLDASAKDRDQGMAPALRLLRQERALAEIALGVGPLLLAGVALSQLLPAVGAGLEDLLDPASRWSWRRPRLPLALVLVGVMTLASVAGAGLSRMLSGVRNLDRARRGEAGGSLASHPLAAALWLAPLSMALANSVLLLGLTLLTRLSGRDAVHWMQVFGYGLANLGVPVALLSWLLGGYLERWLPALPTLLPGERLPRAEPRWPLPPAALVRLQARLSEEDVLPCAYCGTDLREDAPVACSLCETMLHPECWEENGRCTTYACPGRHAEPIR